MEAAILNFGLTPFIEKRRNQYIIKTDAVYLKHVIKSVSDRNVLREKEGKK